MSKTTPQSKTFVPLMKSLFAERIGKNEEDWEQYFRVWFEKTVDKFNEIITLEPLAFDECGLVPVTCIRNTFEPLSRFSKPDFTKPDFYSNHWLLIVRVNTDIQFDIVLDNRRDCQSDLYIYEYCDICHQHIFFSIYNLDRLAWYVTNRIDHPVKEPDDNPYATSQYVLDLLHKCPGLDGVKVYDPEATLTDALGDIIHNAMMEGL